MTATVRKPYATDLSDEQWELIVPLIVLPTGGKPKTTDLHEVLNAIYYRLRTGVQWRLLPHALFMKEQSSRRHRPRLFLPLQTVRIIRNHQ